jgi:hypothetical protein
VSLVPLKEEERLQSTIDNERRKKQYKISQHNTTHHKTTQRNTKHRATQQSYLLLPMVTNEIQSKGYILKEKTRVLSLL